VGQFLRSPAVAILAAGFFTVGLRDGTTGCVLAVIEHASRRIRVLGITPHPAGAWVTQQARNLLMDLDGQLETIKFLIRDRDTKFTAAFGEVLHAAHIRILTSPVQAPRANAIMERWIGGCRRELPGRTLIWDQRHLLRVLREYETHHDEHRPHRSSRCPTPPLTSTCSAPGAALCRGGGRQRASAGCPGPRSAALPPARPRRPQPVPTAPRALAQRRTASPARDR